YPNRGVNLLPNSDPTLWIIVYDTVNETSMELGDYQELKKDSVDLYPYLRDIYEQNRDRQIKE
ncbi:MAG: VacJ family lipoprotein, partial [Thiovulaceae bacterium]|nr:VacJ family lipoprotein [Sulfurimonadaceae bacterium]